MNIIKFSVKYLEKTYILQFTFAIKLGDLKCPFIWSDVRLYMKIQFKGQVMVMLTDDQSSSLASVHKGS